MAETGEGGRKGGGLRKFSLRECRMQLDVLSLKGRVGVWALSHSGSGGETVVAFKTLGLRR